ncbi:MAG: AMP-binding protein, partial [Pseudomonadota bacterium]
MSSFSAVIIGNESLAIQCSEMLRDAGHRIAAVVTRNQDIADWAKAADLKVISSDSDLATELGGLDFDWLLSIANLDMIPDAVLALPKRGAVNFHDGPLPRYAGLNAPVWALLAGEAEYGISWHMIAGGVDEGGLLAQSFFDVSPDETVLTLNTKCYAAAIDSFPTVLEKLASDAPVVTEQDLSQRSYFAKNDRPAGAGRIDFTQTARTITTLVRALDHGDYWNPLLCPKIATDRGVFLVSKAVAEKSTSDAAAGTVIAVTDDSITIATATAPVTLSGLRTATGQPVSATEIAKAGDNLPALSAADADALTTALKPTLKQEGKWRKALSAITPATIPLIDMGATQGEVISLTLGGEPDHLAKALGQLGDALSDDPVTLAVGVAHDHPGYLNDWVPVRSGDDLADAKVRGPFAADLLARIPGGVAMPALGLSDAGHIAGTALTVAGTTLTADTGKIAEDAAKLMAARLDHMAAQIAKGETPTILPETERQQILHDWNATETDFPADLCIHQAFEAQVARTPNAEALAFEGESLTYAELNARANALAHILLEKGVGPDVIVGLHLRRSSSLLISALAIMKAGGAYLPMDPAYPADRTAHYIADSGTKIIVTDSSLAADLPQTSAET